MIDASKEKVILVGNPNVGKSVVFGFLTGTYVNVSNYPGTTVEITRGEARLHGEVIEVIDTPGVYSLLPMSEDERVTRDILMAEGGARAVQVADAKNLRRSLMITIQLAEMGRPVVLALNMADEAKERGVMPDVDLLSSRLGISVVPTVAIRKRGVDRLLSFLSEAVPCSVRIDYGEELEAGIASMEALLPESLTMGKRSLALMLLCGDDSLGGWLAENASDETIRRMNLVRNGVEDRLGDIAYAVNRIRFRWIDTLVKEAVREEKPSMEGGFARAFGRWSMDPLHGVPILLVVLFAMYEFVGVFGAGTLVDLLQNRFFNGWLMPHLRPVAERFIPWLFVRDLLVGGYGLISMGLSYAVAIVLPIVATFFFAFGILEDSGYLPRLAVMVDRVFKKIGCNGKAVLPMVLGLGCDTMATLTTRILESKKERVIVTLLLALGVPCSAQLGIILGMIAKLGPVPTMIWVGTTVGVILVVGWLAAKVLPGEASDFIMEIPPVRIPQFSNLLVKTLARIEWYLREAVPLFMVGTLVLFLGDRLGLLVAVREMTEPVVVRMLDLPPETADAFLIGFLRRDYGAAGLSAMFNRGALDPLQALVSLVVITLFIPCLANFLVIIKEHGKRTAAAMALFIFPFAILFGAGLNAVLRALRVSF